MNICQTVVLIYFLQEEIYRAVHSGCAGDKAQNAHPISVKVATGIVTQSADAEYTRSSVLS